MELVLEVVALAREVLVSALEAVESV